MKTWKITEITKVNKWDKWEHWPVYYISMKLDNWEQITLGKKKEDAFKVWDVVNYEEVEEGKKWKEVKENPFPKRSFNSEWNNKGAMIGMAIKVAFEAIYDKKEQNFQETMALAQRIYEEGMKMYNWSDEPTKPESKSESDDYDLPF